MDSDERKKRGKEHSGKDRAFEVANIFEELITAFIMALVIVTFVIRPYIIPTGSMADTLKGAHFRLQCLQCGYSYATNFEPVRYKMPKDTLPRRQVVPPTSRCPSCGYFQFGHRKMPVTKGDKILGAKCLYQIFEPKRWDVVVFRYPTDPPIKYIKRLVALPFETVEIIDGDIYINGRISRKPPKVQNELWMPVYDNDYQPTRPMEGSFNGHIWEQPFRNSSGSSWAIDEKDPTKFRLDDVSGQINELFYDTSIGNDFKTAYAYNEMKVNRHMPYCSDLMVRFYADFSDLNSDVGIALSKYQILYKARLEKNGRMVIAKVQQDSETILVTRQIELPDIDKPVLVKFANVDHQLVFQLGREKLTYDLGTGPEDAGTRQTDVEPEVRIFGSGKITLSHVAIFRDLHYTGKLAAGPLTGRATEGKPLTLAKDEFFLLGDNSPLSGDGRWWTEQGKGNNSRFYREGIVPREYLVAKALFVFWPSGFKPLAGFPFSCVPDVGRMRLIHGGSGKNQ